MKYISVPQNKKLNFIERATNYFLEAFKGQVIGEKENYSPEPVFQQPVKFVAWLTALVVHIAHS